MKKVLNRINRIVTKIREKKLVYKDVKGIELERLGSEYGGWVIPKNYLTKESVCYCVGAGIDITFDFALVRKYNCSVLILDPTPGALSHFEDLVSNTKNNIPTYTNNGTEEYKILVDDIDRVHFYNVGLWSEDTTLKFYAPQNENHISHSAVNLQGTNDFFEAKVNRLSTFLKQQDQHHIDLLKIDIEGAEYQVIDSLLEDKLSIGVICVEFDENSKNHIDLNYIDRIQNRLNQFTEKGYSLIHSEQGNNFTFAKNDVLHRLRNPELI